VDGGALSWHLQGVYPTHPHVSLLVQADAIQLDDGLVVGDRHAWAVQGSVGFRFFFGRGTD